MNTGINAFLMTAAAGLVGAGVSVISGNLLVGAVEIVLGFVAFILYEKFPS